MWAELVSNPDSLKRLLVKLFGLVVILLSPFLAARFGVTISDTQVEMVAGIVATYLLQSGFVAAAKAKADGVVAASQVTTLEKAANDLRPTPPIVGGKL